MFQPTEFQPVQPDGIGKWFEQLKTVLGDSAEPFHQLIKNSSIQGMRWVESTSLCPGAGADDCDAHWHPI
jgi:hypothetical protein